MISTYWRYYPSEIKVCYHKEIETLYCILCKYLSKRTISFFRYLTSRNVRFWHIADQRHWRKAMEDRWEEVKILSCKKYAKSITVGNHSILALSEVHQPVVARSCIRRGYGFRDRSDHQTKHKISSHYEERYLFALCKFKGLASFSRWLSQHY